MREVHVCVVIDLDCITEQTRIGFRLLTEHDQNGLDVHL